MYTITSKCPACNSDMRINKVKCNKCRAEINGIFDFGVLGRLTKEQLSLVELFLKCRGNVKDMEKYLDLSYPTIKMRLEEIIISLGFTNNENLKDPKEKRKSEWLETLTLFEKGKISIKDAAERLINTKINNGGKQ